MDNNWPVFTHRELCRYIWIIIGLCLLTGNFVDIFEYFVVYSQIYYLDNNWPVFTHRELCRYIWIIIGLCLLTGNFVDIFG